MANGVSACTGLVSRDILLDDRLRHFTARLGSEAIRVGQGLGYQLEDIHHIDPELIARAGEGDVNTTSSASPRRASPSVDTGRRWARTWSRVAAPRSSSSTASSSTRASRSAWPRRRTPR